MRRRTGGVGDPNDFTQTIGEPLVNARLGTELLGRAGALFRVGRIALRDLAHLADGGGNLFDAERLFLGRKRDFSNKRVGLPDFFANLCERIAHFDEAFGTISAVENCGLDLFGRLVRRSRAALRPARLLREAAHAHAGRGALTACAGARIAPGHAA